MLISQGSGTDPPGATGGLTLRAALTLAAAQRPIAGVRPSQPTVRGVPRGWTVVAGLPPSRAAVLAGADPGARYFVLRDRAALSRSDITDAYLNFDARGRPVIGIRFTPGGARAFQRLTAEIARRGAMLSTPQLAVNQHLAAVVDGKLISVIFVNYHVYRLGIPSDEATDIAGGFTPLTADHLAKKIAAAPLPADLQLIRATTVSRPVIPGSDLPGGGTTAPRQPAGSA
jgi:preprotein translocase subunit SecD